MADDDFNLESLAAYLHLVAALVQRMADRGQIPGRKVAGAWRFSQGEIHQWLEARIGALDDDELHRLEGSLQRSPRGVDLPVSIVDLLPREAIALPLAARTRSSVIRSMVELSARTGWLWDPDKMADAIRTREDMAPTALDNGVALLHPRRPMPAILAQPFLAFGRTDQRLPFAIGRRVMTDLYFLILSVDDTHHLQTLARLSRHLAIPGFLDQLRAAPDSEALLQLFRDTAPDVV
jgi:PTS system nitrogen regulatory IIA component